MKKVILLLFLISYTVPLFCGNPQIGVKGGVYYSSLRSEFVLETDNLSLTALEDRNMGYHLGVVGSIVFPGFFLQPELLWVNTRHDMVFRYPLKNSDDDFFIQQFHHISLPVLIGMKIGPVRLGAGPVASVYLSQKNNSATHPEMVHRINSASMGYQLSAGFQFGSLLFELRRESNLTKFGDGIDIGGFPFEFDMRPRMMILSLGLLF